MEHEPWITDAADTAAALRSQLNQMAAASQVLELSTGSEKGRSYLAVINQSICRMLRIVGRMELGSRLSCDTLLPKYMDLTPWLEELSRRLEGVLSDIGVTFTLRCPPRLPAHVDGELLRQMLLELISCMAMTGTRITLTAACHERRITFSVSDDGSGQAEDRPVRPAPLEEQEEQTGIALARRIAQLHGGSVVISPHGEGGLSMAASISLGEEPAADLLESPRAPWHSGGFDPVLVAMSELLPARAFLPENLG